VKRVVFCSGKLYYELLKLREDRKAAGEVWDDVALARVEQISPFPYDLVHQHCDNFPNAEVVWCQEEPKNMGAWSYVRRRIETALSKSEHHAGVRPRYVGRPPSASTASGDKLAHNSEQATLIEQAVLTAYPEGSSRSSKVEL